MFRRAALLLCLAAPLAAAAQTTDTLSIDPIGPFGVTDCSPDNPAIQLNWTLTTTAALATGDKFRILATTTNTCPTTDDNLVASIDATANSQTYPTGGASLRLMDLVGKAKSDCTGTADKTIYVCVALRRNNVTTDEKSKLVSFTLQLAPPPAPTGLSVVPGDSALNISWSAGTVGTGQAATDRYRVTVTPPDTGLDGGGPRITETSARSIRQGGLENGVTYTVAVVALSAGGNASLTSLTGSGTPQPVADFFDMCAADPTCPEKGGCDGGPAGLLSLLGLAAALRLARRRP